MCTICKAEQKRNESLNQVDQTKGSKVSLLPLNGGVVVLCECPVCVRLLQLQERGQISIYSTSVNAGYNDITQVYFSVNQLN